MFERMKNSISGSVSPTTEHLGGLKGDLDSRLQHFRQDRSVEQQAELASNFDAVLQAWGIDSEDGISGVLRVLHLRLLLFVAPIFMCSIVVAVMQNLAAFLTLALIALPCLVGTLTTNWRISILKNRQFTSFPQWLASGLGLAKKGS